ncbi:MAG: RNA polymerase sigma factor [Rhodospirillaceae bacterium]
MASDGAHATRFGLLFSRYDRELRRFLSGYLRNKSDVDDCAQESFLNLWKQETRGALHEDPRGYLFITARNVVRDFLRKGRARRSEAHVELSEELDAVRYTEAETTLMHREGLRLIEAQLEVLRPSTRLVFLLHYVELMPFDAIAKRLGISTRTVEREMARALDHCREALGPTCMDILSD